jgi:hypothetical protein
MMQAGAVRAFPPFISGFLFCWGLFFGVFFGGFGGPLERIVSSMRRCVALLFVLFFLLFVSFCVLSLLFVSCWTSALAELSAHVIVCVGVVCALLIPAWALFVTMRM